MINLEAAKEIFTKCMPDYRCDYFYDLDEVYVFHLVIDDSNRLPDNISYVAVDKDTGLLHGISMVYWGGRILDSEPIPFEQELKHYASMNNFLDENALMHYGVAGMKWGVWNDETSAKYAGGSGIRSALSTNKTLTGLKRNVRNQGLIRGVTDTKLTGKDAGKLRSSVKLKKVKQQQAAEDRRAMAKLIQKGYSKETAAEQVRAQRDMKADAKLQKSMHKLNEKIQKRNTKNLTQNHQKYYKKASAMSDEELNTAINRMRTEDTYNQLVSSRLNKSKPQKQDGLIKRAAKQGAANLVSTVIQTAGSNILKNSVDNITKVSQQTQIAESVANFLETYDLTGRSMAEVKFAYETESKYPGIANATLKRRHP